MWKLSFSTKFGQVQNFLTSSTCNNMEKNLSGQKPLVLGLSLLAIFKKLKDFSHFLTNQSIEKPVKKLLFRRYQIRFSFTVSLTSLSWNYGVMPLAFCFILFPADPQSKGKKPTRKLIEERKKTESKKYQ